MNEWDRTAQHRQLVFDWQSCGTSHASAVSTPLRWIFKKRAIKASHSCRTAYKRSECSRERRIALYKRSSINQSVQVWLSQCSLDQVDAAEWGVSQHQSLTYLVEVGLGVGLGVQNINTFLIIIAPCSVLIQVIDNTSTDQLHLCFRFGDSAYRTDEKF